MRVNKIAQPFLIGMAIIATLFVYNEGFNQYNEIRNSLLRNLLDQNKVNQICSKANFTNGIASYVLNFTDSLSNTSNAISNSLNSYNSTDAQGLIDYIKNNKQEDLTNYVIKRVSPYIVFLAFAVISIICWLIFLICCCCPCCCCSPKGCCCQGETCPNISVFLAMICYAGIIICCIIGFIFSAKFVKDVNSVTCQFLTFYSNTINGQNITTTPKWVGVTGIKQIFTDTNTALDKISQNSQTAFQNTSWTQTDPANFESMLNTSYNKFSSRSLTNRNPATSKKSAATIVPLYIKNYGSYYTSNTLLNAIYQEFNTKIKYSISLIDQAKQYSQSISQNSQSIKDTINSINTSLDPLTTSFTDLEKTVINQWMDYQIIINDSAINGFLIVYAVLAGIACLSLVFMLLYVCCCKFKLFKFFLHLFWIIIMIVMVLTFILGTVFGVIGLISSDGVTVFKWIFGSENLLSDNRKIITDKSAASYINICFNGNGDLATNAFGTSSGSAQYLDKLYNVSNVLVNTKNQINANKNSIAISSINSQLDDAKNNIVITTDLTYNQDALVNVFLEWNAYTDSSVKGSYQKSCTSNTRDYWVSNATLCPDSYTLINAGGSNIGNPSCLVLSSWSASQVSTRYGTAPSGCGPTGSSDFSTISSASTTYFNSMTSYSNDNSNLIDEVKAETSNINSSFTSMAGKMLDLLTRVDGVISPLVDIFQKFVGDQGLFSLINCSYMGRDFNTLFNIMSNELAISSKNLCAVVIAVSFLEFLSVITILIVLLRKNENAEKAHNPTGTDMELGMKNN